MGQVGSEVLGEHIELKFWLHLMRSYGAAALTLLHAKQTAQLDKALAPTTQRLRLVLQEGLCTCSRAVQLWEQGGVRPAHSGQEFHSQQLSGGGGDLVAH